MNAIINLATKNKEDYTITPDGGAFTTQRKAAELCGVSRGAVRGYFSPRNVDLKQGVSAENLSLLAQHYARKGHPAAIATLVKFSEAGAQAYIYTEAGYDITVSKPTAPVGPEYITVADLAAILPGLIEAIVTPLFTKLFSQVVQHPAPTDVFPAAGAIAQAVEYPTRPAKRLAPGFVSLAQIQQGVFRGHSDQVIIDAMVAYKVPLQYFDHQFSEAKVNTGCKSYQDNLIEDAYHHFIRHSTRYIKKNGEESKKRWLNPLLSGTHYEFNGVYEVHVISFL